MTNTVGTPVRPPLPSGNEGDALVYTNDSPISLRFAPTPGGRNIHTFSQYDPVSADILPALREIANDYVANRPRIWFPPGTYPMTRAVGAANRIPVVPGLGIIGSGPGKTIFQLSGYTDPAGDPGTNLFVFGTDNPNSPSFSDASYAAGVEFRDFTAIGERTGSTYYNAKSAPFVGSYGGLGDTSMTQDWSDPDDDIHGSRSGSEDWIFENIVFQDMWGHTVHTTGYDRAWTMRNIKLKRCYNGLNANVFRGTFQDITGDGDGIGAEGLEIAVRHGIIDNVRVTDYTGAGLAVNNFANPGSALKPGSVRISNITIVKGIKNSIAGTGIIISTGAGHTSLTNFAVLWPSEVGLQIGLASGEGVYDPADDITVTGGHVLTPGAADASAGTQVGINCYRNDVSFSQVQAEADGTSGYSPAVAFAIGGSRCSMDLCTIKGSWSFAGIRLLAQNGTAYTGGQDFYLGPGNWYDTSVANIIRNNGGTFRDGSVIRHAETGFVRPTAAVEWRGLTSHLQKAAADDSVAKCIREAAGTYAWKELY